jgi:signal peptidase I
VRIAVGVGLLVAVLVVATGVGLGLVLHSIGYSPGASTVHVIGSAMAPTVRDGDYALAQPYGSTTPRVGDVVLLRIPHDPSRVRMKRVVATPGHSVLWKDGQLIVDGTPQSEPYLGRHTPWFRVAPWPTNGTPQTMGGDQYFVLGDNRDNSTDSRLFGPVRLADIVGHVTRIVSPPAHARRL